MIKAGETNFTKTAFVRCFKIFTRNLIKIFRDHYNSFPQCICKSEEHFKMQLIAQNTNGTVNTIQYNLLQEELTIPKYKNK